MEMRQAEMRKEDGNLCFKKQKIGAAIDAYTEAIALCPDVAIYWTNRAICYRKRKEWRRVEEDCRRALQLDKNSIKAHYMLGLSLLEKENFSGGITELTKALDIVKRTDLYGAEKDEIYQSLIKAKFTEWELTSSERSWRLQNLKETCESALIEQNFLDADFGNNISLNINSNSSSNILSQKLGLLNEVFYKSSEDDTPTDVPDYLCCKITFDIFTDPVITPSGITYERSALLEHLKKVGRFDPVTRQPLFERQLVPNLAIKGAVQAYLWKHGWAYKMA